MFDLPPPLTADQPTEPFIRRLAARYALVLLLIAALVAVDQALIQPLLTRLNSSAPTINVAGRQRMLSQRLAKAALALQASTADDARQKYRLELAATLEQWSTAHADFRRGNPAKDLDKLNSPEMDRAWLELQPHFEAMLAAAESLAQSSGAADLALVGQIVEHEPSYLPVMDRIVKLLEESSEKQVRHLRLVGLSIALAVIALLLGLGWFVVRPATRTIRTQFDHLEARVSQRTAALAAANRALEHEIMERAAAEANTQRLAAQLAHAARVSALAHLAVGLAHEINQPLAAIANYASAGEVRMQRESETDTQTAQYLDQIKRAALRAGQIVRRIRNFAQPNSGTLEITSLHLLVREVAELCYFEAEQADVRLTLELMAREDSVLVDAIQIQQVLVNLVQNGIHAIKNSSTAARQIIIRTKSLDGQLQVQVHDTGPGFGDLDPDAIFAPFFSSKPDGLGIGLSICRSIIDRHGGMIWAEAGPQGGALLSFTLPLHVSHAAIRRDSDPRAAQVLDEANCT